LKGITVVGRLAYDRPSLLEDATDVRGYVFGHINGSRRAAGHTIWRAVSRGIFEEVFR
jgi:hypothetical protein